MIFQLLQTSLTQRYLLAKKTPQLSSFNAQLLHGLYHLMHWHPLFEKKKKELLNTLYH